MNSVIEVAGLTKRYRDTTALADVSFAVAADSITGLLGRNGAGKTTLMAILTGQAFASTGKVRIFGANPLENDDVLARLCFVRESQRYPNNFRVSDVMAAASHFYDAFDMDLAETLITEFDLPRRRQVQKLSRGMKSAVGIVVGLASRAPITFFDEPYLGLDATARQLFYDRLIGDFAEHPRTVVLSTHLIDEVGSLLDDVLILDKGRLVVADAADNLRGLATTLVGNRGSVDDIAQGHPIVSRHDLGGRSSVTVRGALDAAERTRAAELAVDLQPVTLQQLVMTAGESMAEPSARPIATSPNGGTR